jgi:hypothetical protein
VRVPGGHAAPSALTVAARAATATAAPSAAAPVAATASRLARRVRRAHAQAATVRDADAEVAAAGALKRRIECEASPSEQS